MNAGLYIAKRYFLSRKKQNFINIIAIISILVVAVGTMALVVALSVFNGLEELLKKLHGTRDPEIKLTLKRGKSFHVNENFIDSVKNTEGVDVVTEVIEDNALLKYENKQVVVKIKGVSDNYNKQYNLQSMIVEGKMKLKKQDVNYAVLGRGIKNRLSAPVGNQYKPIEVWYPKKGKTQVINPKNAFNTKKIIPGGVFAIERQYDESYVYVPLRFAKDIVNYDNRLTYLEIKTKKGYSMDRVQNNLNKWLPDKFETLDIREQHATLLKAVKIEKLFVYLTFTFILSIASLNIFFSLSMLVLEKHRDVSVLKSLGASKQLIKKIFMLDGALIAFAGSFTGLIMGVLICFFQQRFGIVSMGMETSILEAYPIEMKFIDFLITAITIILITIIATIKPSNKATKISATFN